ncbi:MAG TPA: outer membrane beta-barrel protein [Bacteroidia bacterium]|nr:outer membrane beta-barrel protein [Bacteroidia bacterium]
MKLKSTYLFLLFAFAINLNAQDGMPYRKGKVKHRISIGAVKSYYINHPQHTRNTKAKFGFTASYKSEILLGRKTNILIGLDYFNHSVIFNGYYKAPTYTYLYDETFAYTHEIRIQEIQIPLALKITFNSEKEHFYSPYFIGGVGARYIFGAYSVISNDSTELTVYDAKDNIDFENQRVRKGLNAFYHAGLGIQYNFRDSGRALFFEVNYRYGISRFHYDGNEGSNNLNIKDNHLVFAIGMRL